MLVILTHQLNFQIMSLFLETKTTEGNPVKYRIGFKHEPYSEIKFKQNRLTKKGKIVEVDVVVRKTRTGEANISIVDADGKKTTISEAISVCQPEDNYSKSFARIASFAKALATSGLPKHTKGELLTAFVTRTGTYDYYEMLSIVSHLHDHEIVNIQADIEHDVQLKKQQGDEKRAAHLASLEP